jgi:hypothetical protein
MYHHGWMEGMWTRQLEPLHNVMGTQEREGIVTHLELY